MNEKMQALYDALKRIQQYSSVAHLKRCSLKEYGLEPEEAIEYAYENVLLEAKTAIKGMRRPAGRTEIEELVAVGHKHGWNGVTNSKILSVFFDDGFTNLISARDEYRRTLAAQRTALLSLSSRIRREGMQGVANQIEEIIK